MELEDFEKLLEVYTLDEILDMADISQADLLLLLWENRPFEVPFRPL